MRLEQFKKMSLLERYHKYVIKGGKVLPGDLDILVTIEVSRDVHIKVTDPATKTQIGLCYKSGKRHKIGHRELMALVRKYIQNGPDELKTKWKVFSEKDKVAKTRNPFHINVVSQNLSPSSPSAQMRNYISDSDIPEDEEITVDDAAKD